VGTGSRDGQRLDHVGVAADVGQVEVAHSEREDRRVAIRRRRALAAAEDRRHLRQAAGPHHVEPVDEAGLQRPLKRDHEPRQPGSGGPLRHCQCAAAGADLAPSPSSPNTA